MAKKKAEKKQASEAPAPVPPDKALAPQADKSLAKAGGTRLAGRGFENLETSDVLLPRLKLLQPLSPECNGENHEKPGSIFLALSGESHGQKIVITPIMHFRSRIKWNDRDDGGGIDCSAADAKAPRDTKYAKECSACHFAEWDNEAKNKKDQMPKCTLYDNFLVLVGDSTEPMLLPMERTKMKVARKLYSMGALKGGDMWDHQYIITTVKETNDKNQPYFNYAVTDASKKTSPEIRKRCEEIWTSMRGRTISEKNQEQDSPAPAGSPEPAPSGGGY